MYYYGYDGNDLIRDVANSRKTIEYAGYEDDRIAKVDDDMEYPDFEQGQWKHTENGPELVS